MSFNIFEGARRLALLTGGVATLLTVTTWYNSESYPTVYYEITQPGMSFHRQDADLCPSDGIRQHFKATSKRGGPVWVSLCAMPMEFKGGVKLIPYKVDDKGMIWGASRYSSEVDEYLKNLEKFFKIPEEHQVEIYGDQHHA